MLPSEARPESDGRDVEGAVSGRRLAAEGASDGAATGAHVGGTLAVLGTGHGDVRGVGSTRKTSVGGKAKAVGSKVAVGEATGSGGAAVGGPLTIPAG